jgi:hypothetical protein
VTNRAQNNVEQISYHVTLSFEMIHMSHVHSSISIIAKLGVINSQFSRFLRLCSCKESIASQSVTLINIVLLKNGKPCSRYSVKED